MTYTEPDIEDEAQEEAPQANALEVLVQIAGIQNIADVLDEQPLGEIAQTVCDEYKVDKESRADWQKRNEEAMNLATLVAEEKSFPFEGAANVKYPLLAEAALEFNAMAYPAIVPGNDVVRCQTWGDDEDGSKAARGERVSRHMSWQLLSEDPLWEQDTDKLLVRLPIVGCDFRKVYYDPALGRKVSRLVTSDRFVMNYWGGGLATCPRYTEEINLYPHEIEERIRSGRFIKFEYGQATEPEEGKESASVGNDKSAPHLFLEQHRLLDLDEDGYPEPYIVTVHNQSQKVCRIVANFGTNDIDEATGKVLSIRKRDYYTQYDFLPNPEGGSYGVGLGYYLFDLAATINTVTNQLLDAGTLANTQGGLISSALGVRDKSIMLDRGEWKVLRTSANLGQSVYPIKYDPPSPALFNLLSLMIEAGKDVSGVKDILTGELSKNLAPTTALALIEQGMKRFTAIYKRIHRALKHEFGLHAQINQETVSPEAYNAFQDGSEQFNPQEDYSEADMDIVPVSDPTAVSKMQQMAKVQYLQAVGRGNPLYNQMELEQRGLEAAGIDGIDQLLVPPQPPNPEEEMLKRIAAELALQSQEADILKTITDAVKNIAQAEGEEAGQQIQLYTAVLNAIRQGEASGQGRLGTMAGQPGNAGGNGPAGQGAAGASPANNGGPVGPIDPIAAGMGQPAPGSGLSSGQA